MEVVITSYEERESPVYAVMVVEEGGDGRLEEVAEEGARGCNGARWVPDVAVKLACADGWAFKGL